MYRCFILAPGVPGGALSCRPSFSGHCVSGLWCTWLCSCRRCFLLRSYWCVWSLLFYCYFPAREIPSPGMQALNLVCSSLVRLLSLFLCFVPLDYPAVPYAFSGPGRLEASILGARAREGGGIRSVHLGVETFMIAGIGYSFPRRSSFLIQSGGGGVACLGLQKVRGRPAAFLFRSIRVFCASAAVFVG